MKADSLKKAAELITQRIEAMTKDQGDSKKNIDQIKALKQVLLDLEKAKTKEIQLKVGEPKVAPYRLQVLRVPAPDPKVAAETKAKIDSAKARVAALRKEFDEKRVQLQKAQVELVKLSAEARVQTRMVVREMRLARPVAVKGRVVVKPVPPGEAKPAEKEQRHAKNDSKPNSHVDGTKINDSGLTSSDHKRLESLEKKLEKLLDEVASLRKHDKNSD